MIFTVNNVFWNYFASIFLQNFQEFSFFYKTFDDNRNRSWTAFENYLGLRGKSIFLTCHVTLLFYCGIMDAPIYAMGFFSDEVGLMDMIYRYWGFTSKDLGRRTVTWPHGLYLIF